MTDLASWLDAWDLILQNGNVAQPTRMVYLRSVRQFLDHLGVRQAWPGPAPGGVTRGL